MIIIREVQPVDQTTRSRRKTREGGREGRRRNRVKQTQIPSGCLS
jgi:hypothetical protein